MNNAQINGENDPDKPYNMALARKVARDVLYGIERKIRRAKESGETWSREDDERYAMGKIYDGLIIARSRQLES